jgi:hypothetical protein
MALDPCVAEVAVAAAASADVFNEPLHIRQLSNASKTLTFTVQTALPQGLVHAWQVL